MQSNIKSACRIVGMALFSAILCMFVQFSFHFMIKGFSTEVIGYEVHEVLEDGSDIDRGFIAKADKPEIAENNMKYVSVFSEIPTSAKAVEVILSTVFSLGILFCTSGSVLANLAAKDRNDCDFNGVPHNKNRGLIIGLMAAVPAAVMYIAALILRLLPSKPAFNWFYWVYRFIVMGPVKPLNDVLVGSSADLASVSVLKLALQGVYILLFVVFCYLLYRICYNEDSVIAKLLYKSARKDQNVRRLGSR